MMRLSMTVIVVFGTFVLANHSAVAFELNLYGVGHLSADNVDDGQDSSIYMTSSSSRLGFVGSHYIDSDLKVFFQYETGVDLTAQGENDGNGGANSTGQIFTKGRPTFVGLSGNFGKFLIGHMPALDQWVNDYNLFADQVGDLGNLWEGSGVPGRVDNVLQYTSPDMNGFNVAVSYVPEEGDDDSDNVFVKGNYTRGPLKLGAAYALVGQGMDKDEHTAAAITVGYDFGRLSIGGGFQSESDIGGVSGADRDSFTIGASIKAGAKGTLKAQFANSDGDADESDATQSAIAYDYALDKNTVLYVAYARMSNDDNVSFSANGKGHGDKVTPVMGEDPSAVSFGIVSKFDVSLAK